MEYLGDAVLDIIVSEYLFLKYTDKDEGFLSTQRALIVARLHLNAIGEILIEESSIKRKTQFVSDNMYGNILESLIGAIYLDSGYASAKQFTLDNIINPKELQNTDYKSKIILWAQKNKLKNTFNVIKKEGPDHQKKYFVSLTIEDKITENSWGSTIKEAEQKASKKVYLSLDENTLHT